MINNYEEFLQEINQQIQPANEQVSRQAECYWDRIAKPLKSLGKMETMVTKIAGMSRTLNVDVSKRALIIMCADNGVVEEGVTQTGQEVTGIVAENFLDEKSCVAIMCKQTNTKICPVDIGMVTDTKRVEKKKVMYGTHNFCVQPAMSRQQAAQAICYGFEKVQELFQEGFRLIATGEMGIGNTTTSSAVTAVLLQKEVEQVTGRGAGLSQEGLKKKITAIKKGIELHHPDERDVLDVLSKVGGLDIAGLTGVYLGCAFYQIPVIIDGFISGTAALCASKLNPKTLDYMLASHCSKEAGSQMIIKQLGLDAMIQGDLSLGEGSGGVLLIPILDMATRIFSQMETFDGINMEAYQPLN